MCVSPRYTLKFLNSTSLHLSLVHLASSGYQQTNNMHQVATYIHAFYETIYIFWFLQDNISQLRGFSLKVQRSLFVTLGFALISMRYFVVKMLIQLARFFSLCSNLLLNSFPINIVARWFRFFYVFSTQL